MSQGRQEPTQLRGWDWPQRRRWASLGLLLASLVAIPFGSHWAGALEELPPARPVPEMARYGNLHGYNLGSTTVQQQGVAAEFERLPMPLTGLIGLPPGDGPFPLVVILHGRHQGCHFAAAGLSQWPCAPGTETRYDVGLAYLAQALTEAGYGVLVPNLNGVFTNTYGVTAENRNLLVDQRSQQVIDAHLRRLAIAQQDGSMAFGTPLGDRIDWSTLAMVGHSMGGGAAALSALRRQGNRSATAVAQGLGPVSALVLVSPTRSHPIDRYPGAYQLADVPTVVLMGGCDRDIVDFSSLYYLETARQDDQRTALAAAVLLLGANHNFFNAALGQDDYYRQADNAALCNPQRSHQRLSRVTQETFLAQYTPAFLNAVLKSLPPPDPWVALGLAPQQAAPNRVFDLPVLTVLTLPATQQYSVFDAGEASPRFQASPHLAVAFCPAFAPCSGVPHRQPQFPASLTLHWSAPTEFLHLPLEPVDLSQFDSLQLRLATDGASQASVGLAVILRDRDGQAVRVEIPATTPALTVLGDQAASGSGHAWVYPTTVRIPLAQFQGVDLTALTAVELVFDQAPQGTLYLASVEFLAAR